MLRRLHLLINSNIPRIHANMESLADSFGHPVHLDGQVRHTFPTPERLAEAGEAALRALVWASGRSTWPGPP